MKKIHTITGNVLLKKGEAGCHCHKGQPHIYASFLSLEGFENYKIGYDSEIIAWVKAMFDFDNLEGRKIKITAELLD